MKERTARLNDNRNGLLERGDLLMLERGRILAVMSVNRHMGIGPRAQVCIRQVCEQFFCRSRREVRQGAW